MWHSLSVSAFRFGILTTSCMPTVIGFLLLYHDFLLKVLLEWASLQTAFFNNRSFFTNKSFDMQVNMLPVEVMMEDGLSGTRELVD